MLPGIHVFPALGAAIEVIARDQVTDGSDTSSYSVSVNIGAEDAGKVVYVGVTAEAIAAAVDSVSVDGVSATRLAGVDAGLSTAEVWAAETPTSSGTVTVAVTMPDIAVGVAVAVTAVKNVRNPLTPTFTGTDTDNGTNDSTTVASVTADAGGFVFAVGSSSNAIETQGTASWTNLTERYDGGPTEFASTQGDDVFLSGLAATSVTISWDPTQGDSAMALVSVR